MTRPQPRTPGPQIRAEDRNPRVRISTATQYVVEGPLKVEVSMPKAYVGRPDIVFAWGKFQAILKDEAAVRSFAEGLWELLRVAEIAYPNLDAALKEQRLARQRELQRETRGEDREYLNGGLTPLERAMEQVRRNAEMLAPVVAPIEEELGGMGL